MKHKLIAASVAAGVLFASQGQAQVFTPTFLSPVPSNDFGVYVSDWGGDALGVEGIWRRQSRGGGNVGIHAGYVDLGDGSLSLGVDLRNPVILAGAPIGLAFTVGAQAVVGDATSVGGQVGFTAGQGLPAGNMVVTPYIHPRLAIANGFVGDQADGRGFEVDVLADVGLDLDFRSGVSLRFGANLGDGANWGLGVAFKQ
jgi:hypothetical protein